jgi:hypothetical protein
MKLSLSKAAIVAINASLWFVFILIALFFFWEPSSSAW